MRWLIQLLKSLWAPPATPPRLDVDFSGAFTLSEADRERIRQRQQSQLTLPDDGEDMPISRGFPRPLYVLALLLPLLWVAGAGEARAQFAAKAPRAIIQGPSVAEPGEMVILDASQSEGANQFKWTIAPELRGRKQLLVSEDGKRCTVASYGGRYLITLAVSNAEGIDLLTWDLSVRGPSPCPPPEPQPVVPDPLPVPPGPPPTPVPVPPTPDVIPLGEFGVAPKVAEIVRKIVDPNKAATAKQLADAADALAAQMVALPTETMYVNTLLASVGATLNATNNPAWQAVAAEFSKILGDAYAAHKAGRLKVSTIGAIVDKKAWATLLKEVAVGVRAGAK